MSPVSRSSHSRARWVWAVPVVVAVVLVAAFGSVLARSQPPLTGTNSVPLRAAVAGVAPNQQLCQAAQLMPAGSTRMRLFLTPVKSGTPETLVTIRQPDDGVIAREPGRYHDRVVDVTFDPIRRTRLDAEICVRNTGTRGLVLAGITTAFGNARLGDRKLQSAVTVLWFGAGKQSWLSQLSAIAPRVGHARLGGAWAFWVAALLSVLAAGVSVLVVVRVSQE